MAKFIPLEEALAGPPIPNEDGKPSKPGRFIPLAEATGMPDATGVAALIEDVRGFATNPQSYKDMAGYAVGVGAQLSDMFTGLGKSLLGGTAYLLERADSRAGGATPQRSAVKAQAAKDMFPEELATPWRKVAQAMGPDALNAYENNGVGWVMGKIGELIEHGGKAAEKKWGIPAGDVANAADLFMGVLGAKALKPQAQAMLKTRLGQIRSDVKAAKTARPLTPEELAGAYAGTGRFRPGTSPEGKPTDFAATQELPAFEATQEVRVGASEAPAVEAAPNAVPPAPDNINPYKVAGIAAGGTAAAWALQNQLDDDQLIALGIAGAAGIVRLDGVPEPRLVDMLKQGGPTREAAAAQIYRDHVPMLTRSLQKYAKQGVEIEDVVQRTMEKGLRAIEKGSFTGDAAIGTYLYRIADNEAKSGLRYEKVRPKTESMDMEETPGAGKGDESRPSPHENIADESLTGMSPEKVALNNALGVKMSAALDKLPENFRRPFELRELEGMDYADIAKELGQPIGTVRSQINRAKEYLQQSLREYEADVKPAVRAVPKVEKPAEAVVENAPLETSRDIFGGNQRGSASPEQLFMTAAATAGATLGAVVSEDSPLTGALYGALGGGLGSGFLGTAKGRGLLKQAAKSPDAFLGLTSTRLGKIAPELKGRYREHAQRVLVGLDTVHDQVHPFLVALDKLPKATHDLVALGLMNKDFSAAKAIPELAATLPMVEKTLARLESQLRSLGRFGEGVGEYFPRLVRDYDGLKNALGRLDPSLAKGLEKVLVDASADMMRKKGRALTEVEQSLITNRYLYATPATSGLPGYAKTRRLKQVTPELQEFYEPPTESLLRYVSGAINDIETARFFGRDLKVNAQGKQKFTNVDESIGALTARLLESGKINSSQAMEVKNILDARFNGGERGMNRGLAFVRDVTNTALLGNVASAATQIGDSVFTVYHFDLGPTLTGLMQKLVGSSKITPKQLGLVNHVAEELAGKSAASSALQMSLRYSGFMAIDRFAKGLGINAALAKYTGMAKSAAGQVKLTEKYGYAFEGPEMGKLIDDLKAGRVTARTERLVFEALSDTQAISKAEMPEMYLKHPNGRILYQLKTYMLKQGDIVRRDAYDNIASGDPKKIATGLKNIAALATVYALANVPGDIVKDWISGREVDPLSTPKLVENVLQTFGLNRYASDRLQQGKVVDTARDMVTPPVKVLEDIAFARDKAVSYLPLVGRPLYDRQFDGNVKREIAEKRLANKGLSKGTGQELSEDAKEYLNRKKEERKAKQ